MGSIFFIYSFIFLLTIGMHVTWPVKRNRF